MSKAQSEYYFDDTTEYWAQEFAKLGTGAEETYVDRMHQRNEIYREHLAAPFYQLAIRIIHTYHLYYFDLPPEEVAHDAVGFAMTKFSRYIPGRAKAFSFFATVIKRYLINGHNANWCRRKNYVSLEELSGNGEDYIGSFEPMQIANKERNDQKQMLSEIDYLQEIIHTNFHSAHDQVIANAIIQIMKDANEVVSNAHKRIIYSMIKNIVNDTSSSAISRCLAKMKKLHLQFVEQYRKQEENYD